MNTGATITSQRELSRCWLRFSEIVRLFAEKRVQRNEIGEEEYEAIHSGLLKSIRDATESTPEKQELYTRMSELAAPWVHIGSLDQADTRILKDLANRCDEFYHELTNRSPSRHSWGISVALMIVLFAATFALILGGDAWAGIVEKLFDGTGGTLAEWFQALERNRNHSRTVLMAGVAAVATSAVAWLVFRGPKNY